MNMGNTGKLDPMMAVGIVIGLIVGLIGGYFATGSLMQGNENTGMMPAPEIKAGLSDEDKNFMIGLAGQQVDATAFVLASAIDWCTANGGTWNVLQQPGQIEVSAETAQQLDAQGASVIQQEDGTWVADVAVIDRSTCILPQAKVTQ